jgi:hypothetical protein
MDIHDSSGYVIARVVLEGSGLFAAAGYASENFKINPLVTVSEVKILFSSSNLSLLYESEVESVEYQIYKYCSLTSPFLKIKTKDNIFYMNSKNTVYEVDKIEKFSSSYSTTQPNLNEGYVSFNGKSKNIPLINTLTNEIIYLKEMIVVKL